eukprot:TRINITY_DN1106_c0_g1_i3.p1 TRINITY_DN1106_c0_g1~~TRINITY_DN1106_c0_g1_i3.p1  ORF type:complete len:143 (-),score=4.91 TRINITY_DN1106_c0_g1_i3:240-668(-)
MNVSSPLRRSSTNAGSNRELPMLNNEPSVLPGSAGKSARARSVPGGSKRASHPVLLLTAKLHRLWVGGQLVRQVFAQIHKLAIAPQHRELPRLVLSERRLWGKARATRRESKQVCFDIAFRVSSQFFFFFWVGVAFKKSIVN